MSLTKNLGRYTDVQAVFDAVLERGPVTLTFPTSAKANYFKLRAYHYRKLLHEQQAERGNIQLQFTSTPYDDLIFRTGRISEGILRLEKVAFEADVEFDDGMQAIPDLESPTPPSPPEDDLDAEARAFMAELKGKK